LRGLFGKSGGGPSQAFAIRVFVAAFDAGQPRQFVGAETLVDTQIKPLQQAIVGAQVNSGSQLRVAFRALRLNCSPVLHK